LKRGNLAEVVISRRPAQNIALVVKGRTTWRREIGSVGQKPKAHARPKGPQASEPMTFGVF
jgi:hypothetical protein